MTSTFNSGLFSAFRIIDFLARQFGQSLEKSILLCILDGGFPNLLSSETFVVGYPIGASLLDKAL
jgi:hypothetical protein